MGPGSDSLDGRGSVFSPKYNVVRSFWGGHGPFFDFLWSYSYERT